MTVFITLCCLWITAGNSNGEMISVEEMEARSDEVRLREYFNQIGSYQGSYQTLDANGEQIDAREFLIDIQGKRFAGSINRQQSDGQVVSTTWVLNDQHTWSATPVSDLKDDGAVYVRIETVNSPMVPIQLHANHHHLDKLSSIFKPLHMRSELVPNPQLRVQITQEINDADVTIRKYMLYIDGEHVGTYEYAFDMSSGIKLLSARVVKFQDGISEELFHAEYSQHILDNGFWFPAQIEETDNRGSTEKRLRWQFDNVKLNPPLSDDMFIYNIPYGSRVAVQGSKQTYLHGYADPFRETGDDQLPKELRDAIRFNNPQADKEKQEESHRGISPDVENLTDIDDSAAAPPESGVMRNRPMIGWGLLLLVLVAVGVLSWMKLIRKK